MLRIKMSANILYVISHVFNLHVCTVHQQYQSTFLLIQLMHTIIKSREC